MYDTNFTPPVDLGWSGGRHLTLGARSKLHIGREVAEQVQAEYLLRTHREMERAEAEGVRLKERRALLGSRGLATQP